MRQKEDVRRIIFENKNDEMLSIIEDLNIRTIYKAVSTTIIPVLETRIRPCKITTKNIKKQKDF